MNSTLFFTSEPLFGSAWKSLRTRRFVLDCAVVVTHLTDAADPLSCAVSADR